MHGLNGGLFLKTNLLFFLLALSVPSTVTLPYKKIFASLQSHKFDLSIGVLSLTFLLTEYSPLNKSFTNSIFLSQTSI